MSKPKKPKNLESRLSRRDFLKTAGAGALTGVLAGVIPLTASRAYAQGAWDREADVVVVGTGAAAFAAAVTARNEGASVIMLEKAAIVGGTTGRSGGGYWIPNNADLRANGIADPREDAIAYMARYSYPHLYNPEAPNLGLPANEYALIATFYDNASDAVEHLDAIGALRSEAQLPGLPDYAEHLPENRLPLGGRTMYPARGPDSVPAGGAEMIRQLQTWSEANGIDILTGHSVQRLVQNEGGEVIGVEAETRANGSVGIRARQGVVFGSGGFTHNPDLVLHFQPHGTYGGCAVPTNTGDFVTMAGGIGAKLGNMNGAFRLQVVLDQALEYSSILTDVWQPPADSMILVNKYGKRVVNEKRSYNDRTRIHFSYDPSQNDYPNQLLFMVWDQRSAELYANRFPIPAANTTAPYVIRGETLEELGENLKAHVEALAVKVGPISNVGSARVKDEFATNLRDTIDRFNRFAEAGNDEDFGRGSYPYDVTWHRFVFSSPNPDTGHELHETNVTMYPLASEGPYYATILVAGTLDTNGGPVINPDAQVVNTRGEVIPGLYGAGNCIASPTAHAYWGGGATLGPAVAFGYLAGKHIAMQPEHEASLAAPVA